MYTVNPSQSAERPTKESSRKLPDPSYPRNRRSKKQKGEANGLSFSTKTFKWDK
jgi:hypothetical protein